MGNKLTERLQPWRDKIDAIDRQILELLNERAQAAMEIGRIKQAVSIEEPILRPEREAQVIARLIELNQGPVHDDSVSSIWGEVISACRGLESVPRVAYIGPKGTFSEQAALEHFGHFIEKCSCPSFDEVFRMVEAGQADYGIVPVENSTEGAVNRTLDLLLNTSLKVIGERSIRIQHNLLNQSGEAADIKRIMAHPQALAQCQQWLNRNFPNVPRAAAASNAEAARLAAQEPGIAAIAGMQAAEGWGLHVVQQGIQDDPQNRTRFLALGAQANAPSGNDKSSFILAVPNRAGAVYEMLAPLAKHGVSMTRFESRPARTGEWEYYFYVDVLGHYQDDAVQAACAELKKDVAFFKFLGSYPRQST